MEEKVIKMAFIHLIENVSLTPFFSLPLFYTTYKAGYFGNFTTPFFFFFQLSPLFFLSSLSMKILLSRLSPTTPSIFSLSLSLPSLKLASPSPLPPWLLHRSHALPFLTTTAALIIFLRRSSFQHNNNNVSAIEFLSYLLLYDGGSMETSGSGSFLQIWTGVGDGGGVDGCEG